MAEHDRDKITFTLLTNLHKDKKSSIEMRLGARFDDFIELFEEIFEVDLYGYRLKFLDKSTGRQIQQLKEANRKNGNPVVELFVEAPGG